MFNYKLYIKIKTLEIKWKREQCFYQVFCSFYKLSSPNTNPNYSATSTIASAHGTLPFSPVLHPSTPTGAFSCLPSVFYSVSSPNLELPFLSPLLCNIWPNLIAQALLPLPSLSSEIKSSWFPFCLICYSLFYNILAYLYYNICYLLCNWAYWTNSMLCFPK